MKKIFMIIFFFMSISFAYATELSDEKAITVINKIITKDPKIIDPPSYGTAGFGGTPIDSFVLEKTIIIKRGKFNKNKNYWPVRARIKGRVAGTYLSISLKSRPYDDYFDKIIEARLSTNDFDEWEVEIIKTKKTPDDIKYAGIGYNCNVVSSNTEFIKNGLITDYEYIDKNKKKDQRVIFIQEKQPKYGFFYEDLQKWIYDDLEVILKNKNGNIYISQIDDKTISGIETIIYNTNDSIGVTNFYGIRKKEKETLILYDIMKCQEKSKNDNCKIIYGDALQVKIDKNNRKEEYKTKIILGESPKYGYYNSEENKWYWEKLNKKSLKNTELLYGKTKENLFVSIIFNKKHSRYLSNYIAINKNNNVSEISVEVANCQKFSD